MRKSLAYRSLVVSAANLGLVSLWVWLYRGVYPYLQVIFTRQEFRTNQVLLVGVLILIFLQVRKGNFLPRVDTPPHLYYPALLLALGCSLCFLLVERYLDVNTFSASLFGLASYGLLGLWLRPRHWRSGLPAALLLVGALPFGEHLQTFIGYPVRVLTAEVVREGMARFGVQTIGVDTILVFESGMSKVDLPCSGVKSLWTGGLFFLAATWIERRAITFRWMLVGLGFAALLLVANLARVAVLVAVGHVAGWLLLAEMLHVPLGVLGFAGACAAAALLLKWTGDGRKVEITDLGGASPEKLARPAWLMPLLGASVLVMALLYTPRLETALAESPPAWNFPAELTNEPWPLTAGELEWLSQAGIANADRWRFQWRGAGDFTTSVSEDADGEVAGTGLSGSMLLVSSNTWRAHHRPEACLEVYGFSVDHSFTTLVATDFPIRVLALEGERGEVLTTAVYWLQSSGQTTDDYAARIWADLAPQRRRWVLVTILFDRSVDPQNTEAQALFLALRASIWHHLEGGVQE